MSFDTLVRACCDSCGALHDGAGSSEYEAAKEARRDSWEVDEDSGEATCPSCLDEAKVTEEGKGIQGMEDTAPLDLIYEKAFTILMQRLLVSVLATRNPDFVIARDTERMLRLARYILARQDRRARRLP